MSALGLRYCQNHPTWPLILVSKRNGTYWACEHPDDCLYTESVVPGARRRVVAVNGKALSNANRGGAPRRTHGGSSVEKIAEQHEAAQSPATSGEAGRGGRAVG